MTNQQTMVKTFPPFPLHTYDLILESKLSSQITPNFKTASYHHPLNMKCGPSTQGLAGKLPPYSYPLTSWKLFSPLVSSVVVLVHMPSHHQIHLLIHPPHFHTDSTPLTLPQSFGDVVHCDILYGSNTSLKGYRYALFLIDKATRFKFIYGIKTLTDILPTFKRFCADIGTVPKELRTDFDKKLMGQRMQDYMNDQGSVISSVPAGKQRSNGICERSWRSLLRMSRSWLLSNLLPTKFWYHALKRAAEVSNYLPIKVNNKLTTLFEMV